MFFAFHVLNAWEEQVKAKSSAGGTAPAYHSVVKIITSDMFEFELDYTKVERDLSDGERVRTDVQVVSRLSDVLCGEQLSVAWSPFSLLRSAYSPIPMYIHHI